VTRKALATDVERSIDADGVVRCLDRLAAERGAPVYVCFDNGPEFIAMAVADWCRFNGTGTVCIDPGSPWQNAWVESFNGCMRHRCCTRPHPAARTLTSRNVPDPPLALGQGQWCTWHASVSSGRCRSVAPVIMTGTVHRLLELAVPPMVVAHTLALREVQVRALKE
jgi:hypothetical protein